MISCITLCPVSHLYNVISHVSHLLHRTSFGGDSGGISAGIGVRDGGKPWTRRLSITELTQRQTIIHSPIHTPLRAI